MRDLAELAAGAWDDLLSRLGFDDIYLQSAYMESASLLGQGEPRFLHLSGQDGDVVFPCLMRQARDGYVDVGTPMGYGGPVATGADQPVQAFLDAYERWCDRNDVVATFARFHPLLANQRLVEGHWHVERIGHSIGWRLEGEFLAGMSGHHRRLVRKAGTAGVRASTSTEPRELAAFVALYEDTMRRRHASAFYFFPTQYWDFLATALRGRLVRFDAELEGELVASILCLHGGPFLHYHLGCSSEQGQSVGANHLLFQHAATWAAERGFARFHLGGGVGGFEDSLYEFKRRFDPDGAVPACLGKRVHDTDAYLTLSEASAIDYSGYFPAYRARG